MPTAKRIKLSSSPESLSSLTSSVSAQSCCDSNDFEESLINYFQMSEKKHWEDWETELYIQTYVEWHKDGRWEVTRTTFANHTAMAAYLTQEVGVICTGAQSQSKFYRVVDKWRLFTHLRGDSAKPETGIGWDEERRCFLAEKEQWAYLHKLDKSYTDFQHPNSADLMILWDEVMDGKHATGTRAQSSAQHPPQFVPPRARRRRGDSTLKGKGVASSSVINPAESKGTSDDDGSPSMRNLGKRPLGSAPQSSETEGSRGTKSRRSGSENYQEALSNFNRYSSIVCTEREEQEKYSIEVAKQAVLALKLEKTVRMYLLKELLNTQFRALFLSLDESEQRTWIELFIVPNIVVKEGTSGS